jgi:hypothetical protein
MRKTGLLFIMTLILMSSGVESPTVGMNRAVGQIDFVNAVEANDLQAVDAGIKRIMSYLDKPGGPGEDGKIMFQMLLDILPQIAVEKTFSLDFTRNLEKAKVIFKSTSIFNPDGIAYLQKAYQQINSGKIFQMPDSIKSIQDAVNYIKVELANARKDLAAGQTKSCGQRLLEIAVMIVTPMVS